VLLLLLLMLVLLLLCYCAAASAARYTDAGHFMNSTFPDLLQEVERRTQSLLSQHVS
jgi:hypothetical protein